MSMTNCGHSLRYASPDLQNIKALHQQGGGGHVLHPKLQDTAALPVQSLDFPDDLHPDCHPFWEQATTIMAELGTLRAQDVLALRNLCEMQRQRNIIQYELDRLRQDERYLSDFKSNTKYRGMLAALRSFDSICKQWMMELGLTAISRVRLGNAQYSSDGGEAIWEGF